MKGTVLKFQNKESSLASSFCLAERERERRERERRKMRVKDMVVPERERIKRKGKERVIHTHKQEGGVMM